VRIGHYSFTNPSRAAFAIGDFAAPLHRRITLD
jgi:hypothetical protein